MIWLEIDLTSQSAAEYENAEFNLATTERIFHGTQYYQPFLFTMIVFMVRCLSRKRHLWYCEIRLGRLRTMTPQLVGGDAYGTPTVLLPLASRVRQLLQTWRAPHNASPAGK